MPSSRARWLRFGRRGAAVFALVGCTSEGPGDPLDPDVLLEEVGSPGSGEDFTRMWLYGDVLPEQCDCPSGIADWPSFCSAAETRLSTFFLGATQTGGWIALEVPHATALVSLLGPIEADRSFVAGAVSEVEVFTFGRLDVLRVEGTLDPLGSLHAEVAHRMVGDMPWPDDENVLSVDCVERLTLRLCTAPPCA